MTTEAHMKANYWYEIFTSNDVDGTQTIQIFDTQIEAQQYVSNNPEQNLRIDKWKLNEQGISEKVSSSTTNKQP